MRNPKGKESLIAYIDGLIGQPDEQKTLPDRFLGGRNLFDFSNQPGVSPTYQSNFCKRNAGGCKKTPGDA